MARTHILLGYGSAQRDALPHVLHVGRDADAALKARNKALLPGSGVAVVEHLDGPQGYRKTNDNPGEPCVVVDDSAVSQADKEQLAFALEEAERRLKEADDKLEAAVLANAEMLKTNQDLQEALNAERDANKARISEFEVKITDLQSRLAGQMAGKVKK